MPVNLLSQHKEKMKPKRPPTNTNHVQIHSKVKPELTEGFYRFITMLVSSIPVHSLIENMTIKGDKLFIHYKVAGKFSKRSEALLKGPSIAAGNLRVLNLVNGEILEQLKGVYQVRMPDRVF